jgi:hypothetical protein
MIHCLTFDFSKPSNVRFKVFRLAADYRIILKERMLFTLIDLHALKPEGILQLFYYHSKIGALNRKTLTDTLFHARINYF